MVVKANDLATAVAAVAPLARLFTGARHLLVTSFVGNVTAFDIPMSSPVRAGHSLSRAEPGRARPCETVNPARATKREGD